MSNFSNPAPAYERDPEHFIKVPVTDGNGNVIGHASQFKGAAPSTAAGRYEYDRRRRVLRDEAVAWVGDTYFAASKITSDRRIFRALSNSPKLAWNTREDLLTLAKVAQSQLREMTQKWLDTGRQPKPTTLTHIVIPDEFVREK